MDRGDGADAGGQDVPVRVMKARLGAQGAGMATARQWLSDKMLAAWARESASFAPGLIDGARARFQTIATNWRGSRETLLAGRLLTVAVKWGRCIAIASTLWPPVMQREPPNERRAVSEARTTPRPSRRPA